MKRLGIIGGMGTEATVNMFSRVVNSTSADCDQEHLEVFIHNNSKVPDRTEAILNKGTSPVAEILRSVAFLEKCSVELIIVPCMTSHYFFSEVQRQTSIPILNAIQETAKYISGLQANVIKAGIIATSGTVESGLFQKALAEQGIASLVPNKREQKGLVMEAIYGARGIKAGYSHGEPRDRLVKVAQMLVADGADCIIAGCTEVPLALKQDDLDVPLIDPIEILAVEAVRFCGGKVMTNNINEQLT